MTSGHDGAMKIRLREDRDLERCAELVRETRERDNYPPWLGYAVEEFLAPPTELASWVADEDGRVIGHIALHSRGARETMALASEVAGLAQDQLVVVARLFVASAARRQGAGRALLTTATAEAHHRGLRPILDTAPHLTAASELYRAEGWTHAGEVAIVLPDGTNLPAFVLLGPEPPVTGPLSDGSSASP